MDIRRLPPLRLAFVSYAVRFAEMGAAQRDARVLLDAALAGSVAAPRRFTAWRMLADGLVAYAPGVVLPPADMMTSDLITSDLMASGLAATDTIGLATLPETDAASASLLGGYDRLAASWSALFTACREAGLSPVGPNIEIYADPDADPPETTLHALLADVPFLVPGVPPPRAG